MHKEHLAALQNKHAGLDARIDQESHRPMPDAQEISRLKKEKLRLKEEIQGL